jgi:hypothetical protein
MYELYFKATKKLTNYYLLIKPPCGLYFYLQKESFALL